MTADPVVVDIGATAWVLVASALVLLMTPGIAFFYGGMVRSSNVLGTIMQAFMVMGIVSVVCAPWRRCGGHVGGGLSASSATGARGSMGALRKLTWGG